MAKGHSSACVADGTPELPQDHALLSMDHSLQGSLEDLVLAVLSRAEKRGLLTSSNVLAFEVQQHVSGVFSYPLYLMLWLIQSFLTMLVVKMF